jgi:hypothetical protein
MPSADALRTLVVVGGAATALRRYLLAQVDLQLQAVVNPLQGPRLGSLLRLVESRRPSPRLRLIAGEYYVALVPGHGPRVSSSAAICG